MLWDILSQRTLHEWQLRCPTHQVAFGPDGRHLAVANGNIYVLRLALPPGKFKPTVPVTDEWIKAVANLPAYEQVKEVTAKLKGLNPGFDGKVVYKIENAVVTELSFLTDNVADISPVRVLDRLRVLDCGGTNGQGKLSDLSPLTGMNLTTLSCRDTKVSTLEPLRGMKLIHLACQYTPLWNRFDSRDAAILRSITTLESINHKPAAQFWKELEAEAAWKAVAAKIGEPQTEDEKLRVRQEAAAFVAKYPGTSAAAKGTELLLKLAATNSIGMKLAYVPPGEFTMGSPDAEVNRYPNEGPQHRVRITKPFYIGVYEVKQSEYEKVMNKNPSSFKDSPDHPVEMVNWNDAVEFCKKLSEFSEEKRAGRIYRLPTEAEWEYACRAGTTTVFHYGNSLSPNQANFDGNHPYATEKGQKIGKTTRVGSYVPNAFGLYDMHGNVWEWCLDDARVYQQTDKPIEDPVGPTDNDKQRVFRGGNWNNEGFYARSALRYPEPLLNTHPNLGFRIVCLR